MNGIDCDFHQLMFKLRGPGKTLFHQDVGGTITFCKLMRWVKRVYCHRSIIDIEEKDVEIDIHWTNGSTHTF